jgi:hypothetical protein
MYKNSLIACAIVLIAAASVGFGQESECDKDDVVCLRAEVTALKGGDYMASSKARRRLGRAIEASYPKIRDEVMRTYTEPFRVKVRLHDNTDPFDWLRTYLLSGAEVTNDMAHIGKGEITETDEEGREITRFDSKHIAVGLIIDQRMFQMLEADPAVYAVLDNTNPGVYRDEAEKF